MDAAIKMQIHMLLYDLLAAFDCLSGASAVFSKNKENKGKQNMKNKAKEHKFFLLYEIRCFWLFMQCFYFASHASATW